jgi:hypothetical protein
MRRKEEWQPTYEGIHVWIGRELIEWVRGCSLRRRMD